MSPDIPGTALLSAIFALPLADLAAKSACMVVMSATTAMKSADTVSMSADKRPALATTAIIPEDASPERAKATASWAIPTPQTDRFGSACVWIVAIQHRAEESLRRRCKTCAASH